MNLQPNQKHIHMYINNIEVVCSNQITIVEELTNVNSLVLNNCYPLEWENSKDYTQFYFPEDYSLFKMVYDYTNYDLTTEDNQNLLTENGENINVGNSQAIVFAGVVKRSKTINLNPTNPHFSDLQVLDFKTFLSEGDVLNFVIDDMTIENAIKYVISQYSQYNFVVGNLKLGSKLTDKIYNYNCDKKTLYDVLEYISQLTNSIWKTRYIDDTHIAIDFYLISELPQGINLIYDTNFCKENSIIKIDYSMNSNNYRNKQVMTSDSIMGNALIAEQLLAKETEYALQENVSVIERAILNNVVLRVATTVDKANGKTADLYYTVGSNVITLNEQPMPGQILTINYYPQIVGRQVIINQNEIDRINNQLNNSGTIARYENRKDANTSTELNSIGQTYIQFKGKTEITLTLQTINNDIYNIADTVYFDSNGVNEIKDLEGTYAVKKKTKQIIQNNADDTNHIIYTYELNNNFNFENYINYFDNQRAKLIGNIKEGEYINRYVENYKTYTITFNPPVINGGA